MIHDPIKRCGTVLFGMIHPQDSLLGKPVLTVWVSNDPEEERVQVWPLPADWQLTLVRWSEQQ